MYFTARGFSPYRQLGTALLASFFLAGGFAISSAARDPVVPKDAAAVVNGVALPERIVHAYMLNGQAALGVDEKSEGGREMLAKLRQNIIDEQVERVLIAQEAKRRKIAPSPAEIDTAEARTKTSMVDEARYQKFLQSNHFSREDYRQYVIGSALAGEAMIAAFGKEVTITDEDVQRYYDEHQAEPDFQWPDRATAAHILLGTRRGVLNAQFKLEKKMEPGPELDQAVDAEIERRRTRAEEIRQEALAPGADFAALAKKYSEDFGTRDEGGSLGTFAKGAHPLAFDNVAFSLQPGEIGPVVKTDFGFHILKTLDRQPAGPRALEVMAPEIRRRLLRERQGQKMRAWLDEARKKAVIAIRPAG